MVRETTLNWRDVLSIGRGVWDDVTRCRLAAREWGVALAIHPRFCGPQSVIVCGDSMDGFVESALWRGSLEDRTWEVHTEGAWVNRGPLTVWRRPLNSDVVGRLLRTLLQLRVTSLKDLDSGEGLSSRVYFRQGAFDHEFGFGGDWRQPEHSAYRDLARLFLPYMKPALQLYFSD